MITVNFTRPTDQTWRAGYLEFKDLGKIAGGVTHRYEVWAYAEATVLGWVEWKSSWRCYAFRPSIEFSTWFDSSCLTILGEFAKLRTDERRAQWGPQGRFPDRVA